MRRKKTHLSYHPKADKAPPDQLPEATLQAACFQMAWNEYPATRRLLAYNLGNSANRIQGARNKALGLIAGRADMELLWSGQLHYAEFKTTTGTQSPAQKKFEQVVTMHGATYTLIRTTQEFRSWLTAIVTP